jgi:hypothetical protein
MASTEELRDRADWMLDSDPLKVIEAVNAMLAFADELARDRTGLFIATEICNRIGSALGIQEGSGQ